MVRTLIPSADQQEAALSPDIRDASLYSRAKQIRARRAVRQPDARKEQIKAKATFMNLIAVGFITVGIIGPTVGYFFQLTGMHAPLLNYVIVFGGCGLGGIIFRMASHLMYGALMDPLEPDGA